ncbi:Exodeoxyribonuclease III [Stanieria cyanosphaera PCC 7437]|uniref:Exodeoxyribonuclease III n=1 Tax=Stanieria cyanosphaera (strain ATCC 29371 / PCC 7437) TaxID=111780 RepID=K9XTF3_STAC7|nr:exodeoxyribonuclease III [Stanieria cyanosphaera]AFZ35344.1 Exodeoxyribonuclease III [Stanieria cyanosphaera PCC 7437]
MKIATWNVNSIRTRQQIVVDWLSQNSVDVLCLQETKVIDQDFPRLAFEQLGYHLYISGQKAYNGVAIFSRTPLTEVSSGFSPILGDIVAEFDLQKRVITGVIADIRVVNLYVPNGSAVGSEKYQYKLAWLKLLGEYLATLQDKETREICICGDFNIALEDRDIYNPKGKENHIMSSPTEREALREVLAIGFQDVFRKFNSETGHYSWWDYRAAGFVRNRGWRIDHHYLTQKLYKQAINCKIDLEPRKLDKPSDHAPVILEF